MPLVHKELIPENLLIRKNPPQRKKPNRGYFKLRDDVSQWTKDSISGHFFLTFEVIQRREIFGLRDYKQKTYINFTEESDALIWKLAWTP